MDSTQPRTGSVPSGYLNSRAVIAGLAVLTVGGVIGAWGLGISGTAIARNFRRWLRAQQQQPVVGFARKRTVPAKAATAVGGNGRKKEMATSSVAR